MGSQIDPDPIRASEINAMYILLFILHLLLIFVATGHALLHKRDPRAALGWVGICLIFPIVGPFVYFIFGVNRVRTRAQKLEERSRFLIHLGSDRPEALDVAARSTVPVPEGFARIARISDTVSRWPRTSGNRVEMLLNGEQAYPAMLRAIENARHSVFMTTYIFATDATGRRFIDALGRAGGRGVEVRVLVDGVGEFYSFPRAVTLLRRAGVNAASFLPPRLFPPTFHLNLRNHRKLMVADGRIGFVGGMNIRDRHLVETSSSPDRISDLHFELAGPAVAQVQQTFLEDWGFCTGDRAPVPLLAVETPGDAMCRTVTDGPNEDLDRLALILSGAVSSAQERIRIMTPYFLPARELIGALQSAALRGVAVEVVLPAKNNLPFVSWATRNMLWELLERGIRIYYQPAPFAHSKLFVVDDRYCMIGSPNIDPRSLRLNFELAVEIYDSHFARLAASHIRRVIDRSRETTMADLDARSLPVRLRDAAIWLFSPYL
ncbi:MAG: cardiolipin synthase [Desulfobacterales bacterium]|nr:cardiolipin synthase [Desulfobacterales bacterium]